MLLVGQAVAVESVVGGIDLNHGGDSAGCRNAHGVPELTSAGSVGAVTGVGAMTSTGVVEAGDRPHGRHIQAIAPGRLDMMGVSIDSVTETEAVDRVLNGLAEGRGGWIVTPNVDVLRQAASDVSLRRLISAADLSVPDGMPLVWASRVLRRPLPARVAGSTLLWTLSRAADRSGASVFLLGGDPGTAERAAAVLGRAMPELKICGHHCPPFGFEYSPKEMRTLVERLDRARPNIVFCGLGFPKQERLISQLRVRFPGTWFLGIGIGLAFAGGDVRRCPVWLQNIGLEWLHRLSREPRRLFKRYILRDLPFALVLLAWACAHRRKARR